MRGFQHGRETPSLQEPLGQGGRAPVLAGAEGTRRPRRRLRGRPRPVAGAEESHRRDRGNGATPLSGNRVRGRFLVPRRVEGDGARGPRGAPDGAPGGGRRSLVAVRETVTRPGYAASSART